MNLNRLKKFAQATRQKLLEQVSARVDYVIAVDTPAFREKAALVATIKEEIKAQGKQQLVDKVAYTWFNRFITLRYMDVNDYQPLGIKIVSSLSGQVNPQILQEAFAGHIPEDLNINEQQVLDLLEGRAESRNAENEAYSHLLIGACNYLHRIFPFLFERINDYTELLLPDDLTSPFSVLHDLVLGMTEEDCSQVECIGWIYQFYISGKKDEIFAAKGKVKEEDIPAATQLFTPRWIVEYMVQNTVGKIWMQNHPGSGLKQHMAYYLETEAGQTGDYLRISSPEELTLLDQACGSGHILVYGFELFYKIYEEQGYNPSEIPALIIKNNLFGFEIDSHAAQLAAMAVLLKAREYSNCFFKKAEIPEPQILCFSDHPISSEQIKDVFTELDIELSNELHRDVNLMSQATNLGSLLVPHSQVQVLTTVRERLAAKEAAPNLYLRNQINGLLTALDQLIKLSRRYCCVVDNPPYMGNGKMNEKLSEFVRINYPDSKTDLFSCFIERALLTVPKHGFVGMVTMESWLFLSSYEAFRKNVIDNNKIHSLSHFGWHIMRIAFGTVSFILENAIPENEFKGIYSYMEEEDISKETGRPLVFPVKNNGRYKLANQKDFEKIPGSPVGYWLSAKAIENFTQSPGLSDYAAGRSGMSSCNSERFLRKWWEVYHADINRSQKPQHQSNNGTWFPYNKGGGGRKWYGYNDIVINWREDGHEIKNFVVNNPKDPNTAHWSRRLFNLEYFFQQGLTWSAFTSGSFSLRVISEGVIPGTGSKSLYGLDAKDANSLLGLLNSKVAAYYLSVLSPTLNFEAGDVAKVPVKIKSIDISETVNSCVEIAKLDWDAYEISWEFLKQQLLRHKGQDLEEAYVRYQQYWKNKFFQLHTSEEALNRQFIESYGLQEELTPDVPLEGLTILKEETSIENGRLVFHAQEVMSQFISYSVGCMFGRYSLDKEGLIIASQGETIQDYYHKTGKNESGVSFAPDKDNIIPILEEEWLEDDIVTRFYQFMKVTFGEKGFQRNLDFLEEQLGCTVRKYFTREFYPDHVQRYKKRPIYWMFSSPQGHFNVLIYMHRYTPDTLNKMLNNYLRVFMEKLKTRMETLQQIENTGSPGEKTRALKEMDQINAMLLDCHDYSHNILYPLATERIAVDLDNGVLVNYNCFGKAVKEVEGLNDAKTKKKVKEFDWIDPQIIK